MDLSGQTRIGELAAVHPLTTRVFARRGIDFCCGGGLTLGEVAARKALDVDQLIGELRTELEQPAERSWAAAPLPELIEHLLTAYHRPLDTELPRIQAMARKVFRVHGDTDHERLGSILRVFTALKDELETHMMKEERVLFPMILEGEGYSAGPPISCMEHEHVVAGEALAALRQLTADYTVPEGACTTWRALWASLEALESELHAHIHLENNILFPRALADE